MNFTEYVEEVAKFDIYPSEYNQYILATTGITSELGECIGVLHKAIRSNQSPSETRERLANELADVLWYVAKLYRCDENGYNHVSEYNGNERTLVALHSLLFVHYDSIGYTLMVIDNIAKQYGITMSMLYNISIAKLTDRFMRNVINGYGSDR